MNSLFVVVAALGAVSGTVPWALAVWDGRVPIDRFLLQATGAILAVALGAWTWYATAQDGHGRFLPNILAGIGFALGAFWLLGAGLLYLIWPK